MSRQAGLSFLRATILCGVLAFSGAVIAAEPVADEDLTFFDSASFDMTLAEELAKGREQALVLPSGPFSPNSIPPRLEKWLSVVSKTGGSVKLKRESSGPSTRGILSDVVDLTVKHNAEAEASAMYANAQKYDAVVTFNGNDVTSVRFVKRADAEADHK